MVAGDSQVWVVLGSNSFSGSDFIDLLLSDPSRRVIGISRSPEKGPLSNPYHRHGRDRFAFHQMDLNQDMEAMVALLRDTRPRYVVNFAAQSEVAPSWDHPAQWFQTNVVALAHLIQAIAGHSWLERYVQISSPEVYGTCVGRITEESPMNPSTPYAASKAAADLFLATQVKHRALRLTTIRATNVYGAHQQLFKIIPRSAILLKKGQKIQLHGGGRAVKSYIHIRDVSEGTLRAASHGAPGRMYHLSPSSGIAVCDVVGRICALMGRSLDEATSRTEERLGQDAAYVIDSTRAREELGWEPRVTIEQGLREVVDWVERSWMAIEQEPLEYVHKA